MRAAALLLIGLLGTAAAATVGITDSAAKRRVVGGPGVVGRKEDVPYIICQVRLAIFRRAWVLLACARSAGGTASRRGAAAVCQPRPNFVAPLGHMHACPPPLQVSLVQNSDDGLLHTGTPAPMTKAAL